MKVRKIGVTRKLIIITCVVVLILMSWYFYCTPCLLSSACKTGNR
ncbi:hypothetical protein [Butyrivibrio sp. MC2013]|nr:hypothetical protein [Butyrivibrio sp. MC2013]